MPKLPSLPLRSTLFGKEKRRKQCLMTPSSRRILRSNKKRHQFTSAECLFDKNKHPDVVP